eukprot:jgi/Chrzof1/2474/Cz11g16310.t1
MAPGLPRNGSPDTDTRTSNHMSAVITGAAVTAITLLIILASLPASASAPYASAYWRNIKRPVTPQPAVTHALQPNMFGTTTTHAALVYSTALYRTPANRTKVAPVSMTRRLLQPSDVGVDSDDDFGEASEERVTDLLTEAIKTQLDTTQNHDANSAVTYTNDGFVEQGTNYAANGRYADASKQTVDVRSGTDQSGAYTSGASDSRTMGPVGFGRTTDTASIYGVSMNQAIIDPTVTCTGPRCPGGSATTAAAGEASVDSSDGRGAIYNDDYGDYDSGNTTITGPTFSVLVGTSIDYGVAGDYDTVEAADYSTSDEDEKGQLKFVPATARSTTRTKTELNNTNGRAAGGSHIRNEVTNPKAAAHVGTTSLGAVTDVQRITTIEPDGTTTMTISSPDPSRLAGTNAAGLSIGRAYNNSGPGYAGAEATSGGAVNRDGTMGTMGTVLNAASGGKDSIARSQSVSIVNRDGSSVSLGRKRY